jgi:PBP1b-binding outer membrane lipoprotein LpoB
MKKITAIALLSIAIISCQKETKTVTKVDPKTEKPLL